MFFNLLLLSPLIINVLAANLVQVDEQDGSSKITGPIKTLFPAVHWDHDRFNLQHLVPGSDSKMYYADKGKAKPWLAHQFGTIAVNFSMPSVVLEHSAYVGTVQCDQEGMTVPFTNAKAYDLVFQTWEKTGGFALVCHKAQCGQDKSGQRVYWQANQVIFNNYTRTALVRAREIELAQALTHVNLTYGVWQPQDYIPTTTTRKRSNGKTVIRAVRRDAPSKTCGGLPDSTISGFPAASCGPNFDAEIDKKLGYLDFTSNFSDSLRSLAPGLKNFSESTYNQGNIVHGQGPAARALAERSWCGICDRIGNWFVETAQAVVEVVTKAYHAVAGALENVANAVAKAINDAVDAVNKFVVDLANTSFRPSIYTNLGVKAVVAPYEKENPFDSQYAYLILKASGENGDLKGELSLWCLGCGVSGELHLYGYINFVIFKLKVTEGQVSLAGEVRATASLGLDAQVEYNHKYEKPILDYGLPGFSIPKIITIGPVIQLKAVFEIDVKAQGQVVAGVGVYLEGYSATLDLLDSSKSKSTPFRPRFEPHFSAKGQISASAELGIPLSIGVGLVIPLINLDKTISLIEQPSIKASASYETSKNCIDYDVSFINSIDVDFFGLSKLNINTFTKPIIGPGCIEIGKKIGARSISTIGDEFETWHLPAQSPQHADVLFENLISGSPSSYDIVSADPAYAGFAMELMKREEESPPAGVQTIDNSANGTDYQKLNDMAMKEAKADAQPGAKDVQDFGAEYERIFDSTGTYLLSYNDTGNVGLMLSNATGAGLAWQIYKDVVISDIRTRFIHYHENEMSEFGVSRLRLANFSMVPSDAKMVTLVPFNISTISSKPVDSGLDSLTYIGVDPEQSHYFPITCTYGDGQPSKVFLSKDLENGPKKLAEDGLKFIVTGGVVKDCMFMPFVANGTARL